MPQSLSRVLVHLVFSTKDREPFIRSEIQGQLHGYVVGVLKNMKSPSVQIGGVEDHVHVLFILSRTLTQAQVVEELKTSSSKWMKSHAGVFNFAWQAGYGAFSVSESKADAVVEYIRGQEEHHRKVTFQCEFRKFLTRNRIPFDERYVWD